MHVPNCQVAGARLPLIVVTAPATVVIRIEKVFYLQRTIAMAVATTIAGQTDIADA